MKDSKMTETQKPEEKLALFGTKEIQITEEELKKAKLENAKDTKALEIPTFINIDTK